MLLMTWSDGQPFHMLDKAPNPLCQVADVGIPTAFQLGEVAGIWMKNGRKTKGGLPVTAFKLVWENPVDTKMDDTGMRGTAPPPSSQ